MKLKSRFLLFSIVLVLCLSGLMNVSAKIPEIYSFEDGDNDSFYYNYFEDTNTVVQEENTYDELEITNAGYEVNRQNQRLILSISTLEPPIVNESNYLSMLIELENSTSKISMRIFYSSLGTPAGGENTNRTILDVFYQGNTDSNNEQLDITTYVVGRTIFWVVQSSIVDIIRIFDDPDMDFSRFRVEMEYSFGGSSAFIGGDYVRDIIDIQEFDFSGGVQAEGEGIWSILDPVVLGLYFGIPLILISFRKFKL